MKISAKPTSYDESELGTGNRNPVPILADGIGTRIGQTADRLGIRKSAYEVARVSSATLQRYIAEESAPTFEAIARLCLATGVRMEWLATGAGPMLASDSASPDGAAVDWGSLQQAIELVQRLLSGIEGASIQPADFAQAVRDLYDAIEAATADPAALAGKVVQISEYITRRAQGK